MLYRLLCTGGTNPADPHNPADNRDHAGMVMMRDKLGQALATKWVKSLVLVVFTAYLVVAIWGITNVSEGIGITTKINILGLLSYICTNFRDLSKYFNQKFLLHRPGEAKNGELRLLQHRFL